MRFATPRWLGIDEIHLIKPRCVLTNVEKLTTFDILENRNKQTVATRLARLDHCKSIELVTIDMWRPYTESLNNLIRATNRLGRGYSFEALRAKVLLSEGPEKKAVARPAFQKMLSRDFTIETTVHEMRAPTRYEGCHGTLLSTLPEILRKSDLDPKQS